MTQEIEQQTTQPVEKYTLRNAYQWLAMIMMVLDHVGYVYYLPTLRYFGRLGMPLYALLFVMTVRSGHVNFKRLLFIALASQLPVMYIFYYDSISVFIQKPIFDWTLEDFSYIQLNIIFGFAIFAWTVRGIEKKNILQALSGVLMMSIPVSYGWYLYATLFIFWGVRNKLFQVPVFAIVTGIYALGYPILLKLGCNIPTVLYPMLPDIHPRQLLAATVPLIGGIKAVRPNKYLYRYFYPVHLIILAILQYLYIHAII